MSKATLVVAEERTGGQTARFTSSEKQILFDLFLEHQHIIDIKYRKNGRTKKKLMSVRECWEKIVDEYNANPSISTPRNIKQVQKFWLNARLRKKYPFSGSNLPPVHTSTEDPIKIQKRPIKEECDIEIVECHNSSAGESNGNEFISIDQISADKLTLNDLLDFKNVRPARDEVFLVRNRPSTTDKQDLNVEPSLHSTPRSSSVKTPSVDSDHEDSTHVPAVVENIDERFNFFKLRQAELRCKEQEVLLKQKKLELIRMRTEIKNMRELHQLQVESMKIKLRILSAEEKNIINKKDIS